MAAAWPRMATFKAIVIEKTETGPEGRARRFDDTDLMEGDVTVAVEWSTVNTRTGSPLPAKRPWCAASR